jgi:hypothetical protein
VRPGPESRASVEKSMGPGVEKESAADKPPRSEFRLC